MNGFVQSYYESKRQVIEPNVVGYYSAEEVSTFDFFAKNFLVCDHWFSPLPASTQPNRLMALSGYTLRDFTGNFPDVTDQHLVYDWLDGKANWEVYCDGNPFISVIAARLGTILTSAAFKKIPDLNPASLPPVTFIEPRYTNDIATGAAQCDDHWPSGIHQGQLFLFRLYEALFDQGQDSQDLWSGCLMFVVYDEHGGYFDHVSPPVIGTPLPIGASYNRPFFTLGVRVPAFLISPFVTPGSVSTLTLDHTSILKFLGRKFGPDKTYGPWVDERKGIGSIEDVLDNFANPVPQPPRFGDVGTQTALDHIKWMASRPPAASPVGTSDHSLAIDAANRLMRDNYPTEFAAKFPEMEGYLSRLPGPKT